MRAYHDVAPTRAEAESHIVPHASDERQTNHEATESMKHIDRRAFLERGLQLSVGALAATGLSACGDSTGNGASGAQSVSGAQLCADPGALNSSDINARAALAYIEKSADTQKVCAGCVFFHASEQSEACGTCEIFNGGPVNRLGYCNSWTANA